MAPRSKASFEAFKNDLSGLKDPDLEWFLLDDLKAKCWEDVRSWLDERAELYLGKKLLPKHFYRQLLRIAPRFGVPAFDPTGFAHPRIPVESQAYLARRYRTPQALSESALNRNTPRGDTLMAHLLGLISDEAFEHAPVKHIPASRYPVRRRRKR